MDFTLPADDDGGIPILFLFFLFVFVCVFVRCFSVCLFHCLFSYLMPINRGAVELFQWKYPNWMDSSVAFMRNNSDTEKPQAIVIPLYRGYKTSFTERNHSTIDINLHFSNDYTPCGNLVCSTNPRPLSCVFFISFIFIWKQSFSSIIANIFPLLLECIAYIELDYLHKIHVINGVLLM